MAFHVAHDPPIVRVSLSGTLTPADMFALAGELQRIESSLERVPDRIVDMSEVRATGMMFEITLEVARRRRAEVFPNSFRSAILAPKSDTAGFAEIFRILSNNPQIEVKVCASLGEAEEWLGVAAPGSSSSEEATQRR